MCSMKDKNIENYLKTCLQNFKTYYWEEIIKYYESRIKDD